MAWLEIYGLILDFIGLDPSCWDEDGGWLLNLMCLHKLFSVDVFDWVTFTVRIAQTDLIQCSDELAKRMGYLSANHANQQRPSAFPKLVQGICKWHLSWTPLSTCGRVWARWHDGIHMAWMIEWQNPGEEMVNDGGGATLPARFLAVLLNRWTDERTVHPIADSSLGIQFNRKKRLTLKFCQDYFSQWCRDRAQWFCETPRYTRPWSRSNEPEECVVCLDLVADTLLGCHPAHTCVCHLCAKRLKTCPICRSSVKCRFPVRLLP